MRPGILHVRRERDRLPLEQRGARDIHLIVRQLGPNIGIERDLRGRRLRDRPSRGGQTAGDKRQERSAADHRHSSHGDSMWRTDAPRSQAEEPTSPDAGRVGVIMRRAAHDGTAMGCRGGSGQPCARHTIHGAGEAAVCSVAPHPSPRVSRVWESRGCARRPERTLSQTTDHLLPSCSSPDLTTFHRLSWGRVCQRLASRPTCGAGAGAASRVAGLSLL